jgi:uncharacterized membrane protein
MHNLSTISILKRRSRYETWLRKTVEAEAYVSRGAFLLEEYTSNKAESLLYRVKRSMMKMVVMMIMFIIIIIIL